MLRGPGFDFGGLAHVKAGFIAHQKIYVRPMGANFVREAHFDQCENEEREILTKKCTFRR